MNKNYLRKIAKTKIGNGNESFFISTEKTEKYNKKGYNIFHTANGFCKGQIMRNQMVWKFCFESWAQIDQVDGDITTEKFWKKFFDSSLKFSIGRALGRSRNYHKQLSVMVAGKNVYLILHLGEDLRKMRKKVYDNFRSAVAKEIKFYLPSTNSNKDKVVLKLQDFENGLEGVLIPEQNSYFYGGKNDFQDGQMHNVILAKKAISHLSRSSFARMFEKKVSTHYQNLIANDYQKVDVKELFNIRKDRDKSLTGQKNIQKMHDLFFDTYREQLFLSGKGGVKKWLARSINIFYNSKQFIFEKYYGIEKANKINSKVKKGEIIVSYKPKDKQKEYEFVIDEFKFGNKTIKDASSGKTLNPISIFQKLVFSEKIEKIGFERKDFLSYWSRHKAKKMQMFSFWLKECLGVSFMENDKKATIQSLINSFVYDFENIELLADHGHNYKLIKNEKRYQVASSIIDTYNGGILAQNKLFKRLGISKDKIIQNGGMRDCIIFELADLAKTLGYNSSGIITKLKKEIKELDKVYINNQKQRKGKENNCKNKIKLFDFVYVGTKKEILGRGDKNLSHIQESYFDNARKLYVCIKLSQDIRKRGVEYGLSVINHMTDDFLKNTNKTTRNISNIILHHAKIVQGYSKARTNYYLHSQKSLKLEFWKDRGMNISIKTIQRTLKKLEKLGFLNKGGIRKDKLIYEISKNGFNYQKNKKWKNKKGDNKKIKLFEAFAGIGSQHQALKKLGYDVEIKGVCDWYISALIGYGVTHLDLKPQKIDRKKVIKKLKTYNLSNDSKKPAKSLSHLSNKKLSILEQMIDRFGDQDIKNISGEELIKKDIDLFTYSFPCQDISNQGNQAGFGKESNTRSGLLREIERALKEGYEIDKERLPKVLMMENVKNLLNRKYKDDLSYWIDALAKLGYKSTKPFVVNAADIGEVQKRKRVFMFSVLNEKVEEFELQKKYKEREGMYIKDIYEKDMVHKTTDIAEKYEIEYDVGKTKRAIKKAYIKDYSNFNAECYIYYKDGKSPTITSSGANSRIKLFDGGNIKELNSYEHLKLQGFDSREMYDKLKSIGLSENKIKFLAGNSINVKVLEALFEYYL